MISFWPIPLHGAAIIMLAMDNAVVIVLRCRFIVITDLLPHFNTHSRHTCLMVSFELIRKKNCNWVTVFFSFVILHYFRILSLVWFASAGTPRQVLLIFTALRCSILRKKWADSTESVANRICCEKKKNIKAFRQNMYTIFRRQHVLLDIIGLAPDERMMGVLSVHPFLHRPVRRHDLIDKKKRLYFKLPTFSIF